MMRPPRSAQARINWYAGHVLAGGPDTQGQTRSSKRGTALWGITVLALIGMCGVGAYVVYHLHFGQRPPFLDHSEAHQASTTADLGARVGDTIRLAGSGSNIPLTRMLVAAYSASTGDTRIVVHGSIGSTGGIRALRDGVVDLGMVSRPLTETERRLDLVVIPYARVAVVVAVHRSVPEDGLGQSELLDIYRGDRRTWGNGSRLVLLLREKGDSSHLAMSGWLGGFAEVNKHAHRYRLGRVIYNDLDMQNALTNTGGAIGLFDLGALVSQSLPIKVLSIEGIAPSVESVESGRYPIHKDLAFVSASQPEGRSVEFLEFVFSAEGQERIRSAGYVPLPGRRQ